MSYNTKNYMEQGGGKLVIDGELVVTENATVTGLVDVAQLKKPTATQFGGVKAAPAGEGDTVEVKVASTGKLYVPTYPVVPEIPVAANIPASEATTLELLLADFNALLAALKTAGLMAADEPEGEE